MGVLAGTLRTAAGRVLALGGAAVGCGVLALVLAARVSALATDARGARADGLVELAVLTAGALVLVWLAGSAGIAAVCVAARGLGRRWRRGERCVRRFAPAVIRRAMVVVVAAGIGAASVTPASAAELPPTGSPTAAIATADSDGIDLGWVVTGTARGDAAASSRGAPSSAPTRGRATAPDGPTSAAPAPTSAPAPAATPTSGAGPVATPGGSAPVATRAGGPAPVASGPSPTHTPATALQPSAVETPAGERSTAAPLPSWPYGPATPAPTQPPATAGSVVGPDALSIPRAPRWTPVPPVADEAGATVVVARGDTLWDIAARHLAPGASDAQVAAAWPAWYAANTATIGPDPALILPGQVLAVPAEVAR